MQKHVKLFEQFVGELALNEGAVVAKKKFPADEYEAGEDAFEWLMDTLDRVEDIEISDDEEEQVREATPEEVASFVSGLLDRHKIETKRSGRQIEIIVLKSKVNEQLVAEAEAEVKAILSYESPQSSEKVINEGYFNSDMTKVGNAKAYSPADLKKVAQRLNGGSLKATSDQDSITVQHKKDGHFMSFFYDDVWIGQFEDGKMPAGDSAEMDLEEFESEVNDWLNWYE
jgi:chemotaxis protein CheY-P-specific phosphatase CheC